MLLSSVNVGTRYCYCYPPGVETATSSCAQLTHLRLPLLAKFDRQGELRLALVPLLKSTFNSFNRLSIDFQFIQSLDDRHDRTTAGIASSRTRRRALHGYFREADDQRGNCGDRIDPATRYSSNSYSVLLFVGMTMAIDGAETLLGYWWRVLVLFA